MIVDTGQFAALTDEVAAVHELVRMIAKTQFCMEQLASAELASTAVQEELARRQLQPPAGRPAGGARHARPRGQRPGYLSLVQGGAQ